MVRIDFFTKKDAEYSDYMRYIIANTLQEYEGEVTLNQIPENKATEEEISKYGIEVYPTIIVSAEHRVYAQMNKLTEAGAMISLAIELLTSNIRHSYGEINFERHPRPVEVEGEDKH